METSRTLGRHICINSRTACPKTGGGQQGRAETERGAETGKTPGVFRDVKSNLIGSPLHLLGYSFCQERKKGRRGSLKGELGNNFKRLGIRTCQKSPKTNRLGEGRGRKQGGGGWLGKEDGFPLEPCPQTVGRKAYAVQPLFEAQRRLGRKQEEKTWEKKRKGSGGGKKSEF